MPASTVLPEYLKLSLSERIQLVEDIWDSIASEATGEMALTQAQRLELERRMAAHQADPSSAVSWEQVRAKLFSGQS